MNKKIYMTLLIGMIFITTGCGIDQTNVVTCTKKETIETGIKSDVKYRIIHDNNYVKRVEIEEKIITKNKNYLNAHKTTLEQTYKPYEKIKYYQYDMSISEDTLTSKLKINYEKIDTDKMIKIDPSNKSFIKDGKVQLEDMKKLYESLGATCK